MERNVHPAYSVAPLTCNIEYQVNPRACFRLSDSRCSLYCNYSTVQRSSCDGVPRAAGKSCGPMAVTSQSPASTVRLGHETWHAHAAAFLNLPATKASSSTGEEQQPAMDSSCATRRTQRQLPALTPASFRSSSPAAAPHKLEQLRNRPRPQPTDNSNSSSRSRALPSPSIAHVFFNRRPLDLIRRTTSSVLTLEGSDRSALAKVSATAGLSGDERLHRPSCGLHNSDKQHSRSRLQQLKDRSKTKEGARPYSHRRLQLAGAVKDAETEPRKLEGRLQDVAETRKLLTRCPLTGKEVVGREMVKAAELTGLERVEIQQYDEVYFESTLAVKRARCNGCIRNTMPVHGDEPLEVEAEDPNEVPTQLHNDGYDDKDGDYLVLIGDHLAFRYEVLSALGQGAFGQVVRCVDHRTRKQVAVKIVRNRRAYRDQALMEVQVLAQLQRGAAACPEYPHVVCMEDHFEFRDHVCIVFEELGMTLYHYLSIRSFRGGFHGQRPHVLANAARCTDTLDKVTLIDFGSSCLDGSPVATYIQSRFYRSPEVLLGRVCSEAIDMWSLACILVELLTGHPIFAGENEREQFDCIVEVLGVPPVDMVLQAKRRLNFFDEVANPADVESAACVLKPFVNSRGRRRIPGSRSLASVVMTDDSEFLLFLAKCFVWDPSQRLTAEQALEEPWMQRRHCRT
uniref:Protein kinase domain-containing protein n=1 Tax=Peronospora matthiolae TaxID=2874970 RepID=A0AAV1V0J8_9STRA